MLVRIPLDPAEPEGEFAIGLADVLGLIDRRGLVDITDVDRETVGWLDGSYTVYCTVLDDGHTLRAERAATDEDYKAFRVPLWIQGEEVPVCCGKPMVFIGQLDDDEVWGHRPEGARYWWHDRASFYLSTCDQCLGVQAIGQQF